MKRTMKVLLVLLVLTIGGKLSWDAYVDSVFGSECNKDVKRAINFGGIRPAEENEAFTACFDCRGSKVVGMSDEAIRCRDWQRRLGTRP